MTSIETLVETIIEYGYMSGLQINKQKTKNPMKSMTKEEKVC